VEPCRGDGSGQVARRPPMSGCVAPGDKSSGHSPHGEAPPWCAGEGEAACVRPREPPATNDTSPSSAARKEEIW
jgi:hypothetical protein